MNTALKIATPGWLILTAVVLGFFGCNATQIVSERSFEEKVDRLQVGLTSRGEVEALFGAANVVERNRLTYYFADTEFGIGAQRFTAPGSTPAISAGAFPSNTRGVVTTGFNNAGKLRLLTVERYFDEPYVNHYTYLVKENAKEPLEAIATIATDLGFRTADLNKDNGSVTLRDDQTKAQIDIKLTGSTLSLNAKNPHSRVSNEFRIHSRRETQLTSAIARADWVQ